MNWFEILKAETVTSNVPTMRRKLKPIPVAPTNTCVEEFNKIVDVVNEETKRIVSSYTVFKIMKEENNVNSQFTVYGTEDGIILFITFNLNYKVKEEEEACELLRLLSKVDTKLHEVPKYAGMDWGTNLSTIEEQMKIQSKFTTTKAEIYSHISWVEPYKRVKDMSKEDQLKYLPNLSKFVKEYANLHKKIRQMGIDAVNRLGLVK